MTCENFKGESYLGKGVSFMGDGEGCTNDAEYLVAWKVDWANREPDYFEAEVCSECKETLVRLIREKGFTLVKVERLSRDVEICNECGRSVALGSGLFVNRVPDLNDFETRKANGKPYPEGSYVCRECELKPC